MAAEMETEAAAVAQLRVAVRELRGRGLKQAAQFAAELLLGMSEAARRRRVGGVGAGRDGPQDESLEGEDWAEADRFEAAKASFDVGEYLRAHQLLSAASDASPGTGGSSATPKRTPSHKSRFLKHYALYLAGEKAKEEMDLEMNITGAGKDVDRNLHRSGTNPHLKDLYLALSSSYQQNSLDGFGLYLYAVVLKRLGYSTSTGSTQVQSSTPVSMKTRHRADYAEEQKRQQQLSDRQRRLSISSVSTTLTFDVTTRFILIDSIRRYPWNWSAWMELAAHSPFTSNDEDAILAASCPWMFQLFQAHVLMDQQQNDTARALLTHLEGLFPQSTYLLAQQALASYHTRDFDQSEEQFKRLSARDPHRIENMDVYSNVLYVKEDKTELSRLAHRALKVEKYRPETCCIIGNYYSVKNKHDRAIVYFHRALKLDPNFISAWTLIGHEYIEMKNTSAAIEAYRHAVDLSERDYRAWYGLGQAYEILNMFLYSIYYYRKAAAIRPYDARMWCALGGCYEKLNKADEALACFQRAVGNQDREGIASYHLGRIYSLRGEQHEAAKYYQLHLGLPSVSAQSLREQDEDEDTMQVEGGRGDEDEGEVVMLPGGSGANIRVDTPHALAAILFLANYYKQLGQYTEATLFCNRLLDVQGPENEEAKALLREMRSLEAARARFGSLDGP